MLSRLISPLINFARRPLSDWLLLAEAAEILIWSKIQLYTTPFARLAKSLGTSQTETLRLGGGARQPEVLKISWAVQTAARYIPLRLVCLPQAMAASVLLSRRAIDSTLYLGVKMDQANALTAHAWLRSGKKWVTGAAAKQGQTTVACFGQTDSRAVSWITRFRILILLGITAGLATMILMPTPPLHDLTWQDRPDWMRRPIHTIGSNDVWFNLGGFIAASLAFNVSLYGWHRASLRYRWVGLTSFTLLLTILELLQLLLPSRNFDPVDIGMSFLAVLIVFPFWIKRRE